MSGNRRTVTPAWLAALPAGWLAVFFVIPFAIMLAVSVAHRVPGGFFEMGFELDSYRRFLSPFFGGILLTSVLISAAAAVICVTLALPFTLFLSRLRRRGQTLVLVILLSILSLSEVIVGFSLSTLLSKTAGVGNFFVWLGLLEESRSYTPSLFALMTGMCYLALPYSVLVLYPPVSRLDPELGEAARMMGASPWRAFRTVTAPLLRLPLFGALILVFVFTLGVYLLPQVLGQPQHWTLSVHITDQAVFQSNLPFAAAMAVLLLLVSLAMVGLTLLLGRDKGAEA
ncbi:putative spermidine/putrescine transport system permease abc transporter protein [Oceanicola granulosus HTCC2516]|uniref:Putative spermidine/putrescine transport system permease abc transporter protein n=1 Tax=Oceanicola granulosus (strain ATCC BAA-861 / DSM 15982 / KCTC 12143 / HTCC2516) TaxID=314256 RepID=Q2CC47_OCEGH|nr:ABC transporter permease [Oceanicola granulosus]EAR50234.1 putative spermidine/putrescine transport system permease abc transporter protein [Oceanicola granulosus HTCC2516]